MYSSVEKNFTIVPSMCDSSSRLGIPNTFSLFMDIATEHSDLIKIGPRDFLPEGKFWLTVKTKVHFNHRPKLAEPVTLVTWPEKPEKRRMNRDYELLQDGTVLVAGKTEWALLDTKTGRLFHVEKLYPDDMEIIEHLALPAPFSRFSDDFLDAQSLGIYTVSSLDIDLGGHMNNVAYIRAFASMFSTKKWDSMDIHDVEVWYCSQCFEGEKLNIKQKQVGDGTEVCFEKEDGTAGFLLRYS